MSLSLLINEEEYPQIFQIYKKDREKKIQEIFKTGYNIHFPNIQEESQKSEYHTILKSIEDMKQVVYNDGTNSLVMDNKLEDLLQSIQKLTGISNNSSKRGEVGENMLEEIIKQRYGDILFESKAKTPHSGDAWLHLPDEKIIMLESKNYSSRINKDEVEKMEFDMKTNHIRFGIFVSWNSVVQNRKDIDLHSFTHNGETYMVAIISNLGNDIIKLDLSFQIIRKLMDNFYNLRQFPWIFNGIKQNLNELDAIIQKNYQLRDKFYIMNSGVRNCLDMFYQQLRDYQYEINSTAQEIINKIESTMSESLENDIVPNLEAKILDDYKDNAKLFPILSQIYDIFCKDFEIVKEGDSSLKLFKNGDESGIIKIQKKKIILGLNKFGIHLELEPSNYSDCLQIIPSICKNI